MNQNRRNDLVFEPEVFDFNIWMFYSLIQADGYNPLSIKGTKFVMQTEDNEEWMKSLEKKQDIIVNKKNLFMPFLP